jgi:hypothetical protein
MAPPRRQALALLLGLAAGFAGAVLAGRHAAAVSAPAHFSRFTPYLSAEASYFPPFAEMENIALARWHPGQTVVIIGGNSILNGVGQPAGELWSGHLQTLLGDHFVVVNLSFRGGQPAEGGALVAESLLRRGVPVLLVDNTAPGPVGRAYENVYGYLFWQARDRGRLLPHEPRDLDLAARAELLGPAARIRRAEDRLGARLDVFLNFQALWSHVSGRYFSTVWTRFLPRDFWRPRETLPDPEAAPAPLAGRFASGLDVELAIVRGFSAAMGTPDGAGGWRVEDGWIRAAARDLDAVFPDALRQRMLMLLSQNCPYYRDRLTPAERDRDTAVFAAYEQMWRRNGIRCVTAGAGFTAADYRDRTHLAPSGGEKLAGLVAAELRRLDLP